MDTSLSSQDYSRLRKKLVALCYTQVPRHVVEEVADEAMVQLTKRVKINNVTWAFICSRQGTRICEYAIIDAIRVLFRRRTVRPREPELSLQSEKCPEIAYEEEFDNAIMVGQWWNMLSDLQRNVVELRSKSQDYTWCAIGKKLGRSHTWVKISWASAMDKALESGLVA